MQNFTGILGQLFIVGFPDGRPSAAFLDFISEIQPGGVILFAGNCRSHEATAEHIATIKGKFHSSTPFIAVDQEGGRVCRVKGAPAEFPSAWHYGKLGNREIFREQYSRAMVYLESLGFNLNLAPVADLYLNKENDCLKGRCFGDDPKIVSDFVREAVEVSGASKLLSCLKHFPGLGAAAIDPHLETAEADYDERVWQERERQPFAAGIESGADLIMTTHLLLPALDDKIVTGSSKILSTMIRRTLAFEGPIVTDDLTMNGAQVLGDIGERTVAAFAAGHDLLLFGQDLEATMQAYDYFCYALEQGKINPESIQAAISRIAGKKLKMESSVLQ